MRRGRKESFKTMERTGEVTAVNGEWLTVTVCRPADCEKCNACLGSKKRATVAVRGEARLGDLAVVEMPEKTVMGASLLAYALPLLLLLVGLFGGAAMFPASQELAGALGAVLGLAVACAVLALTERRRRQNPAWQPTLKQVIPARPEE